MFAGKEPTEQYEISGGIRSMDYKKIIRSRSTRRKILKALFFVPDKTMIKIQYWIKTGRRLSLNNPKRFTEKIQWYKLYYKNPIMIQCVDKYDVRKYIHKKGYKRILNKCYGIYDNSDSINWEALPDAFVIKNTLSGGSNGVFVIKSKNTEEIRQVKEKITNWGRLKRSKSSGREWPYYSGKMDRILIEKYLEDSSGDLVDYKFFCFYGMTKYFYVRTGYANNHDEGEMAFFDRECNYLPGVGFDYCKIAQVEPALPDNIHEMIDIADNLSRDFPHVRVDLYNIDGLIVFGELTFYNASGYMLFIPDEWDYKFGESFELVKF